MLPDEELPEDEHFEQTPDDADTQEGPVTVGEPVPLSPASATDPATPPALPPEENIPEAPPTVIPEE